MTLIKALKRKVRFTYNGNRYTVEELFQLDEKSIKIIKGYLKEELRLALNTEVESKVDECKLKLDALDVVLTELEKDNKTKADEAQRVMRINKAKELLATREDDELSNLSTEELMKIVKGE